MNNIIGIDEGYQGFYVNHKGSSLSICLSQGNKSWISKAYFHFFSKREISALSDWIEEKSINVDC